MCLRLPSRLAFSTMPGLMMCRRSWLIASDDIFIPAILFAFAHLIGTVSLAAILRRSATTTATDSDELACFKNTHEYVVTFLVVLIVLLVVECLAVLVSCRGTVANSRPRSLLRYIIYLRLVLLIVEFSIVTWGIALIGADNMSFMKVASISKCLDHQLSCSLRKATIGKQLC